MQSAEGLETEAMKKVLVLAAASEAATGLALLMVPSLVGRLLLGAELTGAAVPVARVTGIALIALGIACCPGLTPLCGMLTYNVLATVFFTYLGIRGNWVGPLLWPAVVLHGVIAVFLGRAWLRKPKIDGRNKALASSKDAVVE